MDTTIRIDRIRCDGYGICAELLPELIELDDWGYPIVTGRVPESLAGMARRAAEACPVLAIKLELDARGLASADRSRTPAA